MNCHDFEIQIEELLDGQLDHASENDCLEHASSCPVCGELLQAAEANITDPAGGTGTSLTRTILQHTIGSACGQAREKLPTFVDHELADADRELVSLHLSTCHACSRLAATLSMLKRELPRLAEVPVDDRFTRQVLAATLPYPTRLRRWCQLHWSTWVRRPRFAMEAAYVGSLIVLVVLGAFSTPVAALPQKGLELIRPETGSSSVWVQANEELGTFWEGFASLLESEEENKPVPNEDTP